MTLVAIVLYHLLLLCLSPTASAFSSSSNVNTMSTLSQVAAKFPKKLSNYIGGKAVDAVAKETKILEVPNAATGGILTSYQVSNAEDVNNAVASAKAGQKVWMAMPVKERAKILFTAAGIFRKRNDELAEMEAIDTGRPIAETNCVDIVCAVEALEYMASLCATTAAVGQHICMDGSNPGKSFGYTRREPLGVTAGIGAWNYPLQSAIWKSAPSLACGNSMVFKPADNTPMLAIKLAEIFTEVRPNHVACITSIQSWPFCKAFSHTITAFLMMYRALINAGRCSRWRVQRRSWRRTHDGSSLVQSPRRGQDFLYRFGAYWIKGLRRGGGTNDSRHHGIGWQVALYCHG